MDFLQLAQNRYSVRKFTERPVEREIIEKILQAGMVAPTAKNLQPQRILVMTAKESLEKLDRATKCRFGAPAAMLVCYDRDVCWKRDRYDGKPSGEVDAAIVTTHMMLAAASLGIGTTWVMHFDPVAMRKEFEVTANYEPVAVLIMGTPRLTPSLLPCIKREVLFPSSFPLIGSEQCGSRPHRCGRLPMFHSS